MSILRQSLFVFLIVTSLQSEVYGDSRGKDLSVDYEELRTIGPWDDRNYALTADDIALLALNEAQIREPIPAFYRVHLRKQMAGYAPAPV